MSQRDAAKKRGVVKWFQRVKGYGFIHVAELKEDVFVHYSHVENTPDQLLEEGQIVDLEVEPHERLKWTAKTVRVVTQPREDESLGLTEPDDLAVTLKDGAVRLVSVSRDGVIQFLDPCKHLHGVLYITGSESTSFRVAADEFEGLVNDRSIAEATLQDFFERNPEFILTDEYRAARAHVVLERDGGQPLIPDFMLEPLDSSGLADLLEIKLPSADLFVRKKNRLRYSAAVFEACAQLREYGAYFEDARNRESVRAKYGLVAYQPRRPGRGV